MPLGVSAFFCCLLIVDVTNIMLFYRNIDDVDKTMDEINEQTDSLRQIQEALAAPIGIADFDEV